MRQETQGRQHVEYKCQAELADSKGGPSQGTSSSRDRHRLRSPSDGNSRSNIRESQGGSLPASLWCDSNEAVSYTVVFNLLKEYIMTY